MFQVERDLVVAKLTKQHETEMKQMSEKLDSKEDEFKQLKNEIANRDEELEFLKDELKVKK